MGNAALKKSKENERGIEDTSAGSTRLLPPAAGPITLTEDQKTLIRDSWKLLEKDIAEVGIIVFIK